MQKSNKVFKKIKKKKKEGWSEWTELVDFSFWDNEEDEVWNTAKF